MATTQLPGGAFVVTGDSGTYQIPGGAFINETPEQSYARVYAVNFTPVQGQVYVYPAIADVRWGLSYGPTGTEFTGTFKFNKSIDAFVPAVVDPSSFSIMILPQSKVTLSAEDVRLGVSFGNSEVGTSIGYLSINTTTARIAKPLTEKVVLLS